MPNPSSTPKERVFRLERDLEAACVAYAQSLGLGSRKLNGLGYRSWPDRVFTPPRVKGRTPYRERTRGEPPLLKVLPILWVEFKRKGEVPTAEQRRLHEELAERGQVVLTVDNLTDFQYIAQRFHFLVTHG